MKAFTHLGNLLSNRYSEFFFRAYAKTRRQPGQGYWTRTAMIHPDGKLLVQEGNWRVHRYGSYVEMTHTCDRKWGKEGPLVWSPETIEGRRGRPGEPEFIDDYKGCSQCDQRIPSHVAAIYYIARMCK